MPQKVAVIQYTIRKRSIASVDNSRQAGVYPLINARHHLNDIKTESLVHQIHSILRS